MGDCGIRRAAKIISNDRILEWRKLFRSNNLKMGCMCMHGREKLANTSLKTKSSRSADISLRQNPPTFETSPTDSPWKMDNETAAIASRNPALGVDSGISLRGAENVRLLKKPLTAYYKIISDYEHDPALHLKKAQNLITKQPCLIQYKPTLSNSATQKSEERRYSWKLWSSLDHPHILRTYECLKDEKGEYWVFEDYRGGNAEEWLSREQGRILEKLAMRVMFQVFMALKYIHSKGIVVRNLDLKSLVFPQAGTDTSIEMKLGHLYYACENEACKQLPASTCMSQFLSSDTRTGYSGPECDMWSCGVLLHCLLTGTSPFPSFDSPAKLEAAMQKKVKLTSPRWAEASKDARMLTLRLLSPNKEDRPSVAECLSLPFVLKHGGQYTLVRKDIRKTLTSITAPASRSSVRGAVLRLILTRVIKQDSLALLSETFQALDTDMDGRISRDELLFGLRKVHSESEALRLTEEVMESTDMECRETIDYLEFLMVSHKEQKLLSKENVKKAFLSFDRDKSGKISLEELKDALKLKQSNDGEKVWQAIIRGADRSLDGEIDFSEFQALIESAME